MKNKKGTLTILLGLILTIGELKAQESIQADPLLKFRRFKEIGLSPSISRVNTNHNQFNTPNGNFNFMKNNYLPTIDASFNFGWLLKEKDGNSLWTLKTGVNMISRNANLFDSAGNSLRLSTSYIQIPVQLGFRRPLRFNTVKNNLFRAFEVNGGLYAAIPTYQKLDHPDNIDSQGEYLPANYIRFGIISEMLFTAFDSNGNGHKFGIRSSSDFTRLLKFKDTPHELYPVYYTIGLFYNIANKYR